jgi:hypothetical protein
MMLKTGQKVVISGAAGIVPAEVVHSEDPHRLPSIYGAPEITRVRAIMAEWGVLEVAMLSHLHGGKPVLFCALRDATGWRDLQDQPLTITPLHGEWEITDPTEEL